uniref:Uncharacterized protein n=1 Tax=Nelumbo nucifera TaxID=4432 RepID=A0A822YY05_NELNU|nr:TPA_asm: hypothetical protein HUJ06_007032 [Nelumbo nucifera]
MLYAYSFSELRCACVLCLFGEKDKIGNGSQLLYCGFHLSLVGFRNVDCSRSLVICIRLR